MSITLSRRQALAHLGAAAIVAPPAHAAQAAPHASAAVVQGRVIGGECGHDPLSGVLVSNGRDVTVSAADGTWSLPARADEPIFVIKPPHMRVVDATGEAAPFYVHADAAALQAAVTFLLAPATEPETFDAILLTDTQPDSDAELDFVRDDILAGILEHPAAFGIHHGDVVSDAPHLYPRYQQLLRATGLDWHHCVGNHDLDRGGPEGASSRATWRRTFGPRWYAFHHARAVFFILDNVDDLSRGDGRYQGRLGAEQVAFVRDVLAHVPQDRLIVLSMHIPLRSYLAPDEPSDVTLDYADLLEVLRDRPRCVSFSGHLHATEHHYLPHPGAAPEAPPHHHHVLTAASGSWWSGPKDARGIPCADSTDGTPNGFHVLRIDGTSYRTDFIPAGQGAGAALRAELAPCGEGYGGRDLVVNVFDGGPRTRVRYRVSGEEAWRPMSPQARRDPFACRVLQGDGPRKSWVEPTLSSHIWTAPFAAAAGTAPIRVELDVTDEYGRTTQARIILETRIA